MRITYGKNVEIFLRKIIQKMVNNTLHFVLYLLRIKKFLVILYLDVNTEVISVALAYALSRNEIQFIQSLIPTARRTRPYLDLAKLFARMVFCMILFCFG